MKNYLPETSFVRCRTQKLANPVLIWINNNHLAQSVISEHCYCMPMPGEAPDTYLTTSKIYYGERYGGAGIGANGGGVRCGVDGAVQIKGIGKNILAGTTTDFWHTHGGASLEESIREAIWGEVCHMALPYGATRIYGIVGTGTHVQYMALDGPKSARRVLILREAALRPAHYMRAGLFSPSDEMLATYPPDVVRARAAIQSICVGLQSAFGGQPKHLADLDYINDCLLEMVRRFAVQLAAAQSKRILHGTLNSSNICLDGRWIDAGTISTVSDYGRIILGSNDHPDMWLEHTNFIPVLADLFFYLTKFLNIKVAPEAPPFSQVIAHFEKTLLARFSVEFLKLTGIPEHRLMEIDNGIRTRAYKCFWTVIRAGQREPFKLAPNHVWAMPEKMGHFHLNTIMQISSMCDSERSTVLALERHLSDVVLREEFAACYWLLRQAYLSQPDVHQGNAKVFLAFNALRLNTVFPELYRTNLDKAIESLVADERCVETFIGTILRRAKTLLPEPKDGRINVSAWFKSKVEIDEALGILKDGRLMQSSDILNEIDNSLLTIDQTKMVAQICSAAL